LNYGNCEYEYGEFDSGVNSLKNKLVIGEKEKGSITWGIGKGKRLPKGV